MIQRIQSLFLVFIFAVAVSIIFLPFQSVQIGTDNFLLCLMPGCNTNLVSGSIYAPMALNALVIVFSLVTIFQYKNRRLQMKLSNVLAAFNVFIAGLFFLLSYVKEGYDIVDVKYTAASFLPLLSVLAAFMASYYIKKDEQLVRSADRIR